MTEKYKYLREENIVPLPTALWRSIQKRPQQTALSYFGRNFTYKEVGKLVAGFANMIAEFTPQSRHNKRERVALLLPNIPQFVFAYFGTLLSGNTAVPINFLSVAGDLKTKPAREIIPTPEIKAQLLDSGPLVIIAADFFWPMLERLNLNDTQILLTSPATFLPRHLRLLYHLRAIKTGKWVHIPKRSNVARIEAVGGSIEGPLELFEQYASRNHDLDEVVQLQYTGGTTGIPKGAKLTHRSLISNVWQCREHFGELLDENEVVLGVLPLFHAYGLTVCQNMTLVGLGGKLVLVPEYSQKIVLKTIEREKVTLFPGPNVIFKNLANRLALCDHVPDVCISGAGKLDKRTKQILVEQGITILEGYGLSETSPVVSVELPGKGMPGSIGHPLPGTEVKIVDTKTREECAVGKDGEIYVRGPQVMAGYFNKPEETADVLRAGWFRTGDIGRFDKEGRLWLTDRTKNMCKVNGENVYGAPIEEFLWECLAVKNCVVIGVENQRTGEAPLSFVVLNEGRSIEEVKLYAKQVPNPLWKLKDIILVDDKIFASWTNILGKVNHEDVKQYYRERVKTK